MPEETTTLIITHEAGAEAGILAALESSLETLDNVYDWEVR